MCRNASHHFSTRLFDVVPARKIWAARLQQTAISSTASWMGKLETGNNKTGQWHSPCIFAVPILAQSLRAFLFNGNDASLDLGCKLLPTFLLFFHIRSHLRGAAGPSSVFHQLMPAPRSPQRAGRLASLRGRTGSPSVREGVLLGDCWEAALLPGGCGGSLTGRGYLRNRLNNT